MFEKIKLKIKIAKITGIIIATIFLLMLISNIYLNYKVVKLGNEIKNLDNK
ncbi:MAG: hypothetical protein PHS49_06855 [Candidatus Gracilibacteria bacterium]|nr:hypothetical protein [Candidatus Gracilibacteria bacterium]